MKIKELMERLKEASENGAAYMMSDGEYYDFTGFSIDDNSDVRLYLVQGDEKAQIE